MTKQKKKKAKKTEKPEEKNLLVPLIIMIVLFIATAGITLAVMLKINSDKDMEQQLETTEQEENTTPDEPEESEEPALIDFQPVIDEWAKSVKGNKSILIYDLDLNKKVGSYNPEETYSMASLYKLFVVYEGYKRVESGVWDGEAKAGTTGYTINKCLDLAIRESHSVCAETLWGMIGRDQLDEIIEDEWKITNSNISKLTSNVSDIAKIMKRFYEHPDFNDTKLLENMWDSFLVQPTTTYNWRQGLPSGFLKASVYNKVGWDYNPDGKYWNIYHDAAIVKFPQEDGKTRNYIVVVMTNKIDFKYIKNLGKSLENHFYSF